MSENNPMDMLSKILANPEAINKMGALFNQPQRENKEENVAASNLALTDFSNADGDKSEKLLHALEPFLSNRRRGRIPQMMQVMQIGKMLGGMHKK